MGRWNYKQGETFNREWTGLRYQPAKTEALHGLWDDRYKCHIVPFNLKGFFSPWLEDFIPLKILQRDINAIPTFYFINLWLKVLVAQSCPTLCYPVDYSPQAPLSVELSRQEYWSGCHFLLQGIFPTQGSNQGLLHCRQILPTREAQIFD